MKRILATTLIIILLATNTTWAATVRFEALPSPQAVRLDDKPVKIAAYNISGYNYFKIRDIAAILSETTARFSLSYIKEINGVSVMLGGEYHIEENDLKEIGKNKKWGLKSPQSFYVNGEEAFIEAMNIDGNNYFKLRDLGAWIGIEVDYDAENDLVLMKTKDILVNYEVDTKKVEDFPKTPISVAEELKNIRFFATGSNNLIPKFVPSSNVLMLKDMEGNALDMGTIKAYVKDGELPKALNIDNNGMITKESFKEVGIDPKAEWNIILLLRTRFEEDVPLIQLRNYTKTKVIKQD